MNIFPRINLLRRLWNRDDELAAIDKGIAAAEATADAGERLLQYDALTRQSFELSASDQDRLAFPALACFMGGTLMCIAGLATFNLGVMAWGAALVWGTVAIMREIGADAADAADSRYEACRAARNKLANDTDPKIFAASPQFDQVMRDFPDLSKKFALAAARDRFLAEAAPAPVPAAGLKM